MVKRTILIIAGIAALGVSVLWAGDSASFVDLGFSPDGSVYMFAQYGVQYRSLRSWADLFLVDVVRNNFVSGGRVSYTHDRPIHAGQDGAGALYRTIAENVSLFDRYGMGFPNQGQPLYIALDNDPPPSGETIEFRDFDAGVSYRASLSAGIEGEGENLRSSFSISVESSPGGAYGKSYTAGTPHLKRPLIASYRIKKVLINPQGDSLVFVIEMKRLAEDGPDIRYMVETLRL